MENHFTTRKLFYLKKYEDNLKTENKLLAQYYLGRADELSELENNDNDIKITNLANENHFDFKIKLKNLLKDIEFYQSNNADNSFILGFMIQQIKYLSE